MFALNFLDQKVFNKGQQFLSSKAKYHFEIKC